MPPWSPVTATVDVVCRLHQRINDVYDVSQIDVVVVGIFHQVTHPTCAPAALPQACCKYSEGAAGAHLIGNAVDLYHNYQMRCEKDMFRMLISCATTCRRHLSSTEASGMCFLPCQVAELLVGVPAPIMYWEQGHEWLFGDPVRFQVCDTAHTRNQLIVQQRSAVCHKWEAPQVLKSALVNSVAICVF